MDAVIIKNLSKSFKKKGKPVPVLDRIDLTIEAGDWVSVTGPSGSGKSTLLMLMTGLLKADQGEIKMGGQLVTGQSNGVLANWRRRKVGLVFQNFFLMPYLSAAENVALAGTARPDENLKKAQDLLTGFDMADRLAHLPGELSHGQNQRVAIARALINGPDFLFIDEPTGNLDSESGEGVLEIFRNLNQHPFKSHFFKRRRMPGSENFKKTRIGQDGVGMVSRIIQICPSWVFNSPD